MKRRDAVRGLAIGGLGLSSLGKQCVPPAPKSLLQNPAVNHSVCRWCYGDIPLEEFADQAKDVGVASIELLNPDEWPIVMDRGLKCALANGSQLGITKGFNDPKNHEQLLQDFESVIRQAADAGIKQVICFSGNRNGLSDEMGIEHCAKGLRPVLPFAERHNITIVMELLNSKVDHPDYQCDHTEWGVRLAETLDHPNFKLLYDIYHMQIMEGDVIATITKHKDHIAHYHTGGVPGRNEIDDSQELNYPAIIKAIVETGFDGFIAQEFIPTSDPLSALEKSIKICSV